MRKTHFCAISFVALLAAGCQTITPPSVYCDVTQPITYSRNDTLETRQQIERQNAVWTELCGS